jgi:protein tyrosine phosphatase (PTP) superfamily phosphohydrolase (DUF442 family)
MFKPLFKGLGYCKAGCSCTILYAQYVFDGGLVASRTSVNVKQEFRIVL